IVGAANTGGVDHRNTLVVALVDERAQIGHGNPGVLSAGITPALDGFQNRHGPLVAERIVHVDDEQRRALAEAAAGPVAGCVKNRLVALGEKFIPNGFCHGASFLLFHKLARMLSTKLMSMISSYFTSVLRMPAPRTTALPVSQASRVIMPSLLHIS